MAAGVPSRSTGWNGYHFPSDEESDQSWSTETLAGLIEEAQEKLKGDLSDLIETQETVRAILDNIDELWPEGGAPKELQTLRAISKEIEIKIEERELSSIIKIAEWEAEAKRLIEQIDQLSLKLTTPATISEHQTSIFQLIEQAGKVGQNSPRDGQGAPTMNDLQAAVQKLHLQIRAATSSS